MMPGVPVVSVVMPVRNEERSIEGAIRSVLAQSFRDLELLVVDGASTDRTVELVEALAASEPRVRLLHNPDRTIPHALNLGLRAARGRYLARVDAHASVNDTYLERGVAALEADPKLAAVGGRRIGVAATPSGVAVATALSSRFGVGDSINHYARTAQDTDHASFGVFRVDVLAAVGGWDENLLVNEDVDIDHRILVRGHRIWFDPQMCIFWHVRETIPALARQYRRYGRGKAAMVRKNGAGAVRIRHLAPPGLVCALGVAACATAAGFWPVGLVLVGPYVLAVAGATAATLRVAGPVSPPHAPSDPAQAAPAPAAVPADGDRFTRTGAGRTGERLDTLVPATVAQGRRPTAGRLAAAFVAMHTGWGLGFLEGTLFRLTPAAASARDPRQRRRSGAGSASS